MPRGTRHQRCPHCQQVDTKRHGIMVIQRITLQGARPHGVQRWYCKGCQRAFTPIRTEGHESRYAMEVVEKAAQLYFDQGASYRAVARDLRQLGIRIDAKRCWRLIQDLAARCKAPWELSRDLAPSWSGYLAIDGDSVKVASHRESILLGVDVESLDIPHLILAEHEDAENWVFFLLVLKETLGYPFKGVVSDDDPAIRYALDVVCPGIPHQLCVKHFQDGLHRYLRYQSSHGRGTWREVDRFETAVRYCLYARGLEEACVCLAAIQGDSGFRRIHLDDGIGMLERSFDRLTQHFRHPGLPRTSNVAEGAVRKLDRRLTPMDSFASHETAWNTIKMLAAHGRFRILTDCRRPNQHRNGFAPLELAKVNIHGLNWIHVGQKAPPLQADSMTANPAT